MSYSNLSPSSLSSESNSQRSQDLRQAFNIIHDPINEEKQIETSKSQPQTNRNSKMNHLVKTVNNFLQLYEIYVKLLLGREIKKKDQRIMMNKWGKFIIKAEENMLPEAVLRFPNPDCPNLEALEIMTPLETILFIEKVLKLDLKKIDNRIFLKAIEGVFTKLLPCLKRSRSKFGMKQKSNSQFKSFQHLELMVDQVPLDNQDGPQTPFESITYKGYYQQSRGMRKGDTMHNLVLQMQHKLIGANQIDMKQYKAFDVFDVDYATIKEMKSKIMQGGGYFIQKNGKWYRSNEDTQDVLTLIRNIMLIQIMMNGFSVKSCLSEDGKYILCSLYAHEENLKTLAEKQKLKKKLNFWFTDLFSLEPVDNCFRPLRLNNRLWKPQEYDDVTDMFLYLRPKITNLIEKINFKKISRETNQSRINGQLFQPGKLDLQDDEDQPNDEQWFAFYQYLVHLEKEIQKYRGNFRIDSDCAAIINGQLKPYDLYILRNQKKEEVKQLNKNNIKNESNRFHQLEIKKIQQRVFTVTSEYSNFLTQNEIPNTKLIKLFKKERLAQIYHTLFEEALKVANSQKKNLYTIWDLIEVEKLEPYYIYTKPSPFISPNMKFQHIMCWCKYQINEFKKISIFSPSERLKLTDQAINNLFLLNDLITKNLVTSFFCVNDHFELFGHLTSQQNDIMLEEDFYRKKMYHLEFEWSFNIQKPWSAPINAICDYYGQKIGLYFFYQTYYTKMLLKIAFIALGCSLVQWILQNNQDHLYYLLRITFAFVQIQWTNLFVVMWQKNQIIFNLQFGQSGKDEIQVYRSNFQGQQRRSVENDQLNSISVDEGELYTRMILATVILILLIIVYSGIMIALYILTIALKVSFQEDKNIRNATFEVMVTATLNIVVILFLDKIYDEISTRLTDFENQKTVKDYEQSFVAKKYILYFISYVGPLIVIAFLNEPLNLYCQPTNCQEHIQYHFATMIIWIFFFKTIKIFQLIINVKKIPIFRYQFTNESIFKYVQEQSNRKSYAISQERYGTLEDYMEIFLQNTLLSIFGYSFPFSFFLFWVQNIAQMQADKAKFVYFLQRPWPQNNASLGVWNKILELINYVCILTNTGQMTMEYNRKYGYQIMLVYMTFLISNFFMNFVMNATFGQIPYELNLLISRQKYLLKSTIERFQKSQSSSQQQKQDNLKRFPIFKVYASVCDLQKGDFETVSSEDELESHYDINQMKFLCQNIQKKDVKKQSIQNERSKKQSYQNNNQNEKMLLKQQKMNDNKSKDIIKEVMSDSIIYKYFQKRQFNLFYEIKSWKRHHPHLFLKAIKFLYQKQLLSQHKYIWCDRRVASRVVYMNRKTVALREIELRKYYLLRKNEKKIMEALKEKAKIKFRKQFKMIDPNSKRQDDILELEQLQKKHDTYVNKHTWLESTKTIVIKVKGIWFNSFRKSKKKTRSLNLVKQFFFQTQLIDKMKGESQLQDQIESALGDVRKQQSVTLEQYIKAFWTIQDNSKDEYEIPLCTKELNTFDYYKSKKKSEIYTFIVDKFKDTYVFDYQYQKLQEIKMQFFEEEQFPIEPVKLYRQLSDQVWIAYDPRKRQCLIQFIQIRHDEILKIQPVCLENYGVYYAYGEHQIRLSNIVDQIDDFYIKGYCVFKYDLQIQYTLRNIIRYRNIYSLEYSINELHEFLHANLMLLKQRGHGDLNIDNYYLQGRSYVLLQSSKNNNDIECLALVLLQMILLQPLDSIYDGYKQLNPFHQLRSILMIMIYETPTIDQILDKILSKHSFMEYNINQDERHKKIQSDHTLLGQLALQTHQINFNFRMKHHQETIEEIEKLEDFLMEKKFQRKSTFLDSFLEHLIINQNSIISSAKEIKLLTNILLIIYIKIATQLLTKRNFIDDMERLYHALSRSVENIDDLIKQISFKVKIEQLNSTEQKILLRRKQTRSKSQIDISSLDRLSLISKIRKHPNYVKVIIQLRKELVRYSLQIQTLNSINLYFNKNFLYSAQILENVQKILTELIQSEHKITQVVEEPEDLSPSQFNFDQQSPTLDATLKQYQDQAFDLQKEMDTSPNYCTQLMYYKYLQLLVWFDGGKETFSNNCIDFIEIQIESPIIEYFKANLRVLQKLEIPKDYIAKNKDCEIGKFIVISLNKWIEQTYFIPSKYVLTDDFQFIWKQIMTYSTIEQSIENRQILVKQLYQKKLEQKYLFYEIRVIHQILHIDNYRPLDQYVNFQYLDTNNCKQDFIKNSLINRLKYLHNEISIETNSWFHSSGLLQFRFFYILSICFTFSRKHFENMGQETNNLVYLVEIILEKVVHITESDAYRMKAYQILQKPNSIFELKSDPRPNQVNQIMNSFFYVSQNYSLQDKTLILSNLLDKYGDQIKPSIVILALISYYISKGYNDLAFQLIRQTIKMIHLEAEIFQNAHFTFIDDLHQITLEFNYDVVEYLYPYDCLFKRTSDIRSFSSDQIILNLKYLIYNQFFHQDIDFNIDAIEDQMKLFDQIKNPNLNNLKSIYQLFIILQNLIKGENLQDEIENFIKLEFTQETVYSIIIKSLIVRYYINYKEYHKAKPLLEIIMSFLYTIQMKSKLILHSQKQNYKIINNHSIIQTLFQIEEMEIKQEDNDFFYIHLLDEQFTQETIINYLEVLANIQDEKIELPSIASILQFFFSIKIQETQQNLFKALSQIFLSYASPQGVEQVNEQLGNTVESQIQYFTQQKSVLKDKLNHLFLIKQLSIDESNRINSQINLYNFAIGIYEGIGKGITNKTLLTWSISSAEKALIGYKIISKSFLRQAHFQIADIHLILVECFIQLEQLSTITLHLEAVEDELVSWFKSNRHPLKGYFLIKKGSLRPWMHEQYKNYISQMTEIPRLNKLNIFTIIRGLLLQNRNLLQIFEQNQQDLLSLEANLLYYLRTLDESQLVQGNIFLLEVENDPEILLQQITRISPFDFNGVNILLDAQSIFQQLNQNNKVTQKLQNLIDQLTINQEEQ